MLEAGDKWVISLGIWRPLAADSGWVCKTAKETQMYRTVFWTLWEREGGMIWEHGNETCVISCKK